MRFLKFLLVFCVFFLCVATLTHARTSLSNQYPNVTNDARIIRALDIMDGTSADWAKKAILGNNVTGLPIKVSFRNLAELNRNYADYEALGWKNGKQLFIFVNNKHSNSPPEALASLLSHETVHQDQYNSLEEEAYAWGYEADVWIEMKNRNPALRNIPNGRYPLVDRLNTLSRMFRSGGYSNSLIREHVFSNPGYRGLPRTSPGFEARR